MKGFSSVFVLELVATIRSKALMWLTGAVVAWLVALPRLVTGDGTAEGARELAVQYGLGGAFALTLVTLLTLATGSLARERAAKRLALTLVRPVPRSVLVVAKGAALTLVGAFVLSVAAVVLLGTAPVDVRRPCRHVYRPILPSPRAEAEAMYAAYMENPATPESVRRAKPEAVKRILAEKAVDRYDTVPTNALARWRFDLPPEGARTVRIRFTTALGARQEADGVFRLGTAEGVISNVTQAVLEVPLAAAAAAAPTPGEETLVFENRGRGALLLRPRQDLEILTAADAFGWNLVRATVEMVAVLGLVVAFGLFLSAALSRPVALFVAFVVLLVGEMSPSVLSQYADGLESDPVDRVGLAIARVAAEVTRPVTALDPVSRLAKDVSVECGEVVRTLVADLLLSPLLFACLSALVLPRKTDDA